MFPKKVNHYANGLGGEKLAGTAVREWQFACSASER
jgi:hypothetical protein